MDLKSRYDVLLKLSEAPLIYTKHAREQAKKRKIRLPKRIEHDFYKIERCHNNKDNYIVYDRRSLPRKIMVVRLSREGRGLVITIFRDGVDDVVI